jgi:two-component system, OmpR family, response regulator
MRPVVLIVAGDVKECESLCFALNKADLDTLSAGTCLEAFDLIESSLFDIVVLDADLPDIDGFKILSQFRRKTAAPILVLTGRHFDSEGFDISDIRDTDSMMKPITPRGLILRIKSCLKRVDSANRID